MYSLTLFCDEPEATAKLYATLLNVDVGDTGRMFYQVIADDVRLGFHPSDEKCADGTWVAYWRVDSVDATINELSPLGYVLYRGPLDVDGSRIAQVKSQQGLIVGLAQALSNESS